MSSRVQLAFFVGVLSTAVADCGGGGFSGAPGVPVRGLNAERIAATGAAPRITDGIWGIAGLPSAFVPRSAGAPAAHSWRSAGVSGSASGTVYVSDFGNNDVVLYDAAAPYSSVGTITVGISEPLGNCLDAKHSLYVANSANSTVTVYPKGQTQPSRTYSVGLSAPSGCTVGPNGKLYVVEYSTGAVVEYPAGSSVPSRTLAINKPEGAALDAKDNLYVSYINRGGSGGVTKFLAGAKTGKDLGIFVQYAGDLMIDKAGDLIVADQGLARIDYFKTGSTTAYGAILVKPYDAYKMALDPTGTFLYLATFGNVVGVFDAQPGGAGIASIDTLLSESSGVSVSP